MNKITEPIIMAEDFNDLRNFIDVLVERWGQEEVWDFLEEYLDNLDLEGEES